MKYGVFCKGNDSGFAPKEVNQRGKVTLVGFGTFRATERKARRGANPQRREIIQILAKKVPKFIPRKGLRKEVK